jgi:multimeric flavodoxin WrbA
MLNIKNIASAKITRRQALCTGAAGIAAMGAALSAKELLAAEQPAAMHNDDKNNTMKVLLINGSPHKEGCTFTALSEVAGAIENDGISTDIQWLGNDAICGCRGCGMCRDTGKCIISDMVNETLAKADNYDGFIIGSPVHYAAASGFITPFLDRLFYASGKRFHGKPAAAIVSCRRAGSTAAFEQLNKYFTISHMPVVSSQYWNMVHGNTPDQVRQDQEGLQIMRALGHNMAWLLKCIEAGRRAGIAFPAHERRIGTNFIR